MTKSVFTRKLGPFLLLSFALSSIPPEALAKKEAKTKATSTKLETATVTFPGLRFLSYDEFLELAPQRRGAYLQVLAQVLSDISEYQAKRGTKYVDNSWDQEAFEKLKELFGDIVPEAQAQANEAVWDTNRLRQAGQCIYGLFLSTYNGNSCQPVTSFVVPDGQGGATEFTCAQGEGMCNPTMCGTETATRAVCLPRQRRHSVNCLTTCRARRSNPGFIPPEQIVQRLGRSVYDSQMVRLANFCRVNSQGQFVQAFLQPNECRAIDGQLAAVPELRMARNSPQPGAAPVAEGGPAATLPRGVVRQRPDGAAAPNPAAPGGGANQGAGGAANSGGNNASPDGNPPGGGAAPGGGPQAQAAQPAAPPPPPRHERCRQNIRGADHSYSVGSCMTCMTDQEEAAPFETSDNWLNLLATADTLCGRGDERGSNLVSEQIERIKKFGYCDRRSYLEFRADKSTAVRRQENMPSRALQSALGGASVVGFGNDLDMYDQFGITSAEARSFLCGNEEFRPGALRAQVERLRSFAREKFRSQLAGQDLPVTDLTIGGVNVLDDTNFQRRAEAVSEDGGPVSGVGWQTNVLNEFKAATGLSQLVVSPGMVAAILREEAHKMNSPRANPNVITDRAERFARCAEEAQQKAQSERVRACTHNLVRPTPENLPQLLSEGRNLVGMVEINGQNRCVTIVGTSNNGSQIEVIDPAWNTPRRQMQTADLKVVRQWNCPRPQNQPRPVANPAGPRPGASPANVIQEGGGRDGGIDL